MFKLFGRGKDSAPNADERDQNKRDKEMVERVRREAEARLHALQMESDIMTQRGDR